MSSNNNYPRDFIELLNSVTAKRPATVIRHILQHGYVTSQELKNVYGYNHPPRAVRDVRELGIPIITYRVKGTDGRKVAAYKFGDPADVNRISKAKGRQNISKEIKAALIEKYGEKDFIYLENLPEDELQVDHRIPYEIGGEVPNEGPEDFMLLSASANRLKSHACETCTNWVSKDPGMCQNCFWAYPEEYSHIAGRNERIVVVSLSENDVISEYDQLVDEHGKEAVMNKLTESVQYCILRGEKADFQQRTENG